MSTTTYMANKQSVRPEWYAVDADNEIVGRLAVRIATVLMGKHKPTYTPHVDCGDFVVVTNCERVRFSGQPLAHDKHPYFTKKMLVKEYDHFTGYTSGRKVTTAEQMLERKPDEILRLAVRRMLPKNKLGRQMIKKLKIYAGPNHPHQAQQPADFPDYVR